MIINCAGSIAGKTGAMSSCAEMTSTATMTTTTSSVATASAGNA